jgi:hypothetical protein
VPRLGGSFRLCEEGALSGRLSAPQADAQAGKVGVTVPKDRLRTTLERQGEVRVKVKAAYTPTGGDPRSTTRWVELVLN